MDDTGIVSKCQADLHNPYGDLDGIRQFDSTLRITNWSLSFQKYGFLDSRLMMKNVG